MLKSVTLAFLVLASAGDALRVHGTLIVESSKYTTKLILRCADDSGPADHVFRAWAKPGLTINGSYRGADVEYYGTSLVVILPTDRSVVTFAIGDSSAPAPKGFQTTTYAVVGISHDTGGGAARYRVNVTSAKATATCKEACDVPDPWQ